MLALGAAAEEAIRNAAASAFPGEACGLLIGSIGPSPGAVGEEGTAGSAGSGDSRPNQAHAIRATLCRNLAAADDRYEMHPEDLLAGELQASRDGLAVVGIWHSHPNSPADPSASDHAGAYENWSYVIVSVTAAGTAELKSWRLTGSSFEEQPIERSPGTTVTGNTELPNRWTLYAARLLAVPHALVTAFMAAALIDSWLYPGAKNSEGIGTELALLLAAPAWMFWTMLFLQIIKRRTSK